MHTQREHTIISKAKARIYPDVAIVFTYEKPAREMMIYVTWGMVPGASLGAALGYLEQRR